LSGRGHSLCGELVAVQGAWNALIAVAGTLAGAIMTHFFGRQVAARAERAARHERTRADRLSAYLAFAEAVTECRRAAYDRWHRHHDGLDEDVIAKASAEYYRCLSTAEHALLRVKVLSEIPEVVTTARTALDAATEVRHAKDPRHVTDLGNAAARKADAFVAAAATQIR
jgi:hypothetical protein